MNRVILTNARLTKEVEVRYSNNQKAVCHFTVAHNRGKNKNGEDMGADFIGCVAFDKTAEFMGKWLAKGCRVNIDGTIKTGSYDKDGKKVYTTDVIVNNIEPVDWANGKQGTAEAQATGFAEVDESDIPF